MNVFKFLLEFQSFPRVRSSSSRCPLDVIKVFLIDLRLRFFLADFTVIITVYPLRNLFCRFIQNKSFSYWLNISIFSLST